MMFGMWRRGRGFSVMGMISFVGVMIGLVVLFVTSLLTPIQVVTTSGPAPLGIAPEVVVTTVTNDVGLIVAAIVIGAIVFVTMGVGMGMRLRGHGGDEAEKTKNEDVMEKKKNRLTDSQYAHTSDGETLEVVEDEGDKSFTM